MLVMELHVRYHQITDFTAARSRAGKAYAVEYERVCPYIVYFVYHQTLVIFNLYVLSLKLYFQIILFFHLDQYLLH